MSTRPTAIDLFSGAGGFSLGAEQAGFDLRAAVEIDPIHAAIHHLNFPRTAVLCASVEGIVGGDVLDAAGLRHTRPDLVIGGPPCQGFSLIGHRVLDDPRNALVFHFHRLVLEMQPRFFIMENVPGMATGAHTEVLDELIARFETAGYRVRRPYRTLNAASFAVPQSRERLFLFGARNEERLPEYPSAQTSPPLGSNGLAESLELELGVPTTPTVADALDGLPVIEEFDELFDSDRLELSVPLAPQSSYARRLAGLETDPDDFSQPRATSALILTGCRRAKHTPTSTRRFHATRPGNTEPVSRFFRLPPGGLSNTLRAGTASSRGAFTAPRPIHPHLPRCITVREAARLHSLPDWFRLHSTIWHGFRQIGNSVPPLLGRAVAGSVIRAIGIVPRQRKEILPLGQPELASMSMSQAADFFDVDRHVIAPRQRGARAS